MGYWIQCYAVSVCFRIGQDKYPFAAQLASCIACQTRDHPAEFSLFFEVLGAGILSLPDR